MFSDSSLSPCCSGSLIIPLPNFDYMKSSASNSQTIEMSNITDEFCDCCNAKLSVCRTYYNGRKICSSCYDKENNKADQRHKKHECPKCGHKY